MAVYWAKMRGSLSFVNHEVTMPHAYFIAAHYICSRYCFQPYRLPKAKGDNMANMTIKYKLELESQITQ
jgi:hypothetical protein